MARFATLPHALVRTVNLDQIETVAVYCASQRRVVLPVTLVICHLQCPL